jgi:hypothetical protein
VSLPSNVPRYDSVDLIDLDNVEYLIVERPPGPTLRAWDKLEETERRWTMFEWATFVITQPNRCQRLIDDFAGAYLLSLEVTLQVLQDERNFTPNLDSWLKRQPAYDLTCRGLRTLRHLEAHVRAARLQSQRDSRSYSRFAGAGGSGGTTAWEWPPLTPGDLQALNSPKLSGQELPAWNSQAASLLVPGLMRHGLTQFKILLENA